MKMYMFVLAVIVAVTSTCTAEIIIYADTAGAGTFGHAGTASDPLFPGEQIYVDIFLNHNAHPSNPSYDGYLLSMFGVDMQLTGPGTLGMDPVRTWHPDLGPTTDSSLLLSNNRIDTIGGVAVNGVVGPATLVSGIWVESNNFGLITVDLTLGDFTQYGEYNTWLGSGTGPWEGWIDLTDPQLGDLILGDLVVYAVVPEPATMVLFALGALALKKRR